MVIEVEFDESKYVALLGALGEFDAEQRQEIHTLRSNFPELARWGDQAIEHAWGAYCDRVLMMGWSSDLSRTNDFLNFLAYEQSIGEWPWGSDPLGLDAITGKITK